MNAAQYLIERAGRVERAMRAKGFTRQKLAERAGYDIRTIYKVINAEHVRDKTIIDICRALDIAPELELPPDENQIAPDAYGAYSHSAYRHYEGKYIGYRRSFSNLESFIRIPLEITWDHEDHCFKFSEFQRYTGLDNHDVDHSQSGIVYISSFTDTIHFLTVNQGAVRVVTLTKMKRNGQEKMRGIVLTQCERETYFQPATSAFYMKKITENPEDAEKYKAGPILRNDDEYAEISKEIASIEQDVVFMARPGLPNFGRRISDR